MLSGGNSPLSTFNTKFIIAGPVVFQVRWVKDGLIVIHTSRGGLRGLMLLTSLVTSSPIYALY